MALTRKYINSPNVSGRYNLPVKRGVIHSTEGITRGVDLGNFFANPASQVSSHAGIDDLNDNTVWIYAGRDEAAWTAGNANGDSFQVELCCPSGASANWSTATWKNHPYMLEKCAQWIAEESKYYGLPIVALTNSQAQGGTKGDCQHSNLGAWGGGHYDCGNGFPMQYVLDMAKGGSTAAPTTGGNLPVADYLPMNGGPNIPLALPKSVSYVRFFCNTTEVRLEITFAPQGQYGQNKVISTSSDGPNGVNVPDGCNALIVRRGSEPAGGYPLVSYALQG